MSTVYSFAEGTDDPLQSGNKGANLIIMSKIGLPVPPGFIISISAYMAYRKTGTLPAEEIKTALSNLEKEAGRKLGKGLMVSVRSSGPVSMPGMMDTVLNVKDIGTLLSSTKKVFDSWDNLRAVEYRRQNGISSELGTAVVVQAMVMGNADEKSGTGVVFTRNPSTGEKVLFGEYIHRAQGEDLVSGTRTPTTIDTLKGQMPEPYAELESTGQTLERHFRDMQDIEFTIEKRKLYILQTRSGKRSGSAAVKIAVDMAREGILTKEEALVKITPDNLRALLYKRIRNPEQHVPIAQGLSAAPGTAAGRVVFKPIDAVNWSKKNDRVILVRPETSPDDIQGIASADGVLTSRGGLTSHAAIVTRAMGKPCICGAEAISIDLKREEFEVDGTRVKKGQDITIDGNTGKVYVGVLPMEDAEITPEVNILMEWADSNRRMGVRANADTVEGIVLAKRFGAEGIGLCRTERQFNAPERLSVIREYILAENLAQRSETLEKLRIMQKEDFVALFRELQGMPIIIRLLDLPLHEFLPDEAEARDLATKKRIQELKEINPMLGHRGVRLGITNPEVYQMQIEAINEARAEVPANVSIMIPQVITLQELLWVKKYVKDPTLKLGVMIETVRACLRADMLAEVADFFSFGTNDLSQAIYSFSREDAEKKFLTTYIQLGILQDNPFEVIDVKGAGRLMSLAVSWARSKRKDLEIGVCGEHGGEPRSIQFFNQIGVDYVSCSPFRIFVAKLSAAQANIKSRNPSVAATK